ncbi:MAG: ABC transporter permease [Rhizobacter sp.]|nr:ABC transporter permease [Chlorobiales bacterium]
MLTKLILRNLGRHKLRTVLTALGVAVAVAAFVFLRTCIAMWYVTAETAAESRIVSRNNISMTFPLPLSHRDKVAAVPGVTAVTYSNWFGGIYKDPKEFFSQFAIDAETYFKVYPEFQVKPAELAAFTADRSGCIVGKKLAERYGWKLGDVIRITGTIYEGDWDFTVRAIYTGAKATTDETTFYFDWKYLDERVAASLPSRSGMVGFYIAALQNPNDAASVCATIDGLFANSAAETLTETESAFNLSFVSMSSAIIGALQAVSFVIIGIMLLVLANTMSMSARERLKEYAVLKTLGFSEGFITSLIIGESALLATVGAGLGLLIATPLTKGFGSAVAMFFPVFEVEPLVVASAAIGAIVAGAIAGLFPAQSASKISITDGLRYLG